MVSSFEGRKSRWLASATLAWAWAAGCSLTIDANRVQCSTDQDCKDRGAAFAESRCVASLCQAVKIVEKKPDAAADSGPSSIWSCLYAPPAPAAEPGPFHVVFHLTDVLRSTPQSGVTATLCKKLDVNCDLPIGSPVTSDANGDVAFDVDKGFSGYVSFTRSDITPGLFFFDSAVNGDLNALPVQIITPAILDALTKTVGSPAQPDRGVVLLSTFDCASAGAPGVSYVADGLDSTAVTFYSVGGLPTSKVDATDSAGYGGFVNVLPGTIAVTAKVKDTGRDLETISLVVRAGAITYSRLVPHGQ